MKLAQELPRILLISASFWVFLVLSVLLLLGALD